MGMIIEMSKAIEEYRDAGLQCIFIHPERLPELIRELDKVVWRHDDTGERVGGYLEVLGKQDSRDPDGAIVRVSDIPVFEDVLANPLWTGPPDRKRILFYTRRLQSNGITLLQGWTEDDSTSRSPAAE